MGTSPSVTGKRDRGWATTNTNVISVTTKLGLGGLILLGFALAGIAHAASVRPAADIVYSARYYKPGMRPSHYKIWRINSSGSGRVRVTSGSTNDHSPIWLADGKTILFVREAAKNRILCTVGEGGGPVTELATLPNGYTFIESVAPDRRSVIYVVHDSLVLFDIRTRQERELGTGYTAAWSPDGHWLYVSTWGESTPRAQIVDLATGSQTPLEGDLRAAAWVNYNTLIAEAFAKDKEEARLVVLRADGTKEREIPLPFTWEDEDDNLSPFADNMFAIPGDADAVLYGRYAGDSTAGPAEMFYRVSLKEGEPTVVAKGRDLVWSSDHQFFATGDSRALARLDPKRRVWVSPLSVVSANGKTRKIVQGLVSVGGFDWRPPPEEAPKAFERQRAPKK